MNAITQKSATGGQIKQINRFGADAIEKVLGELGLNNTGAQRVIENGDEFVSAIRNAALASLKDLSSTDKYKEEEVESILGYLSGYEGWSKLVTLIERTEDIARQVLRLEELYPQLVGATVGQVDLLKLPNGAEKFYAIPNIWRPEPILSGDYENCVVGTHERIEKDRDGNFYNCREDKLGTDHLRQATRSEAAYKKISADQGHPDILLIAGQFGLQHRGRSVRRAREVMVYQNQFGLGAFAVGIMILTHPDRLKYLDDLWIDCAGDEFGYPNAVVRFGYALGFLFNGGKVRFGARRVGDTSGFYGSVSGFLAVIFED